MAPEPCPKCGGTEFLTCHPAKCVKCRTELRCRGACSLCEVMEANAARSGLLQAGLTAEQADEVMGVLATVGDVTDEELARVLAMNRTERRAWAREQRKKAKKLGNVQL